MRRVREKLPFLAGYLRGHRIRAGIWAGRRGGRVVFNDLALGVSLRYVRAYFRWYFWAHYHRLTDREWFDHRINLYRWTPDTGDTYWLERGVYVRELLAPGCRVLDLCCGDGFYPYHFYVQQADQVDAVDRDARAITAARRQYAHPRLTYHVADVVTDPWPDATYDVISWDAAVEHFGGAELDTVVGKCRDALGADGVLCGTTPLVRDASPHQDSDNPFHAHDYTSAGELEAMLRRFFAYVAVFATRHPTRENLYFRASQSRDRLGRFAQTEADQRAAADR